MKFISIQIVFVLLVIALFAQSKKDTSKYITLELEKCSKNCVLQHTDTTSYRKLVKFKKEWVSMIYPLSSITFENKEYLFSKDVILFNNQTLENSVFNPETVKGFKIYNSSYEYLVLIGGLQGSTGISSSYSLIIVFDMKNKLKNKKYKVFGGIIKNFQLSNFGDFDNDGKLQLKLDRKSKKNSDIIRFN